MIILLQRIVFYRQSIEGIYANLFDEHCIREMEYKYGEVLGL